MAFFRYKPRVRVPAYLALSWNMAAIFRDSVAVAIVCARPRATPLAMATMKKSIYGFPSLSYIRMVLHLAALRAAEALHKPPSPIITFDIVEFDFSLF